MDDPYARLGLAKGASPDEIRRAYRKEALIHHPDRGGNTEAFQKLEAAYGVLSDPERKALYDATGSVAETPQGNPFGGGFNVNFSDIFGSMFGHGQGQGARSRKQPVGPHKLHEIGVSLADLYHGKQFELRMKRDILCPTCEGHGGLHVETCNTCNGSGIRTTQVQMGPMMMIQQGPCDTCSGKGKKVGDTCTACTGRRLKETETVLQVKIDPGMKEGDRLVFAGQCSESPDFERPGDVVLVLRTSSEEKGSWIRQGAELRRSVTLTWAEAMLGFERVLEDHPSGRPLHIVWTGGFVKSGEVLRVTGWGMPQSLSQFGDLRLICRYETASFSMPEERLADLRRAFPDWKEPVAKPESVIVCGAPEDPNTHYTDC